MKVHTMKAFWEKKTKGKTKKKNGLEGWLKEKLAGSCLLKYNLFKKIFHKLSIHLNYLSLLVLTWGKEKLRILINYKIIIFKIWFGKVDLDNKFIM